VDTVEFGILRFIVDAPKKALSALKLAGFVASLTPVVALRMDDGPGSLTKIAKTIACADVSIEYLYTCVVQETGSAFVILRIEDTVAVVAMLAASSYKACRP